MDAFYEEDEQILGHAADPQHRIDIRRSSRHLVVCDGDEVVADTHAPLVLYESDLAGHGGEQRAVFVYQVESYRYWERELGGATSSRAVRRELHGGRAVRRGGLYR